MGSQWPAMGKSLLKIPIVAESIQKSHDILQTKGVDLIEILTNDDPKIFDNILNSFVGISAIQVNSITSSSLQLIEHIQSIIISPSSFYKIGIYFQ